MSMIVSLVMLLAITMLGLAAIGGSLMQEKIVSNIKDTNLAFQAAEAGLRDAESDIANFLLPTSGFTAACAGGLCTPPASWTPANSNPITSAVTWSSTATTRAYGTDTLAPALPDVASQPQYVVEKLTERNVGQGDSAAIGAAPNSDLPTYYRVTVHATGARADTQVTLQSVYVKY
jgi:type IV pilus assembly protein PilX